MAMLLDHEQEQEPVYKHYCRICKKGFLCGRALGGHMRAHGLNDERAAAAAGREREDRTACGGAEWAGDDCGTSNGSGSKRMYALRTNPNRLRSCRICENCGKEFVSWKSFLEHGRCSSGEEDEGGGEQSMGFLPLGADDTEAGWSTRSRRSTRGSGGVIPDAGLTHCPSSEEEDLANCLMLLSGARLENPTIVVDEDTEESCASASRDCEIQRRSNTAECRRNLMEPAAFADKSKALIISAGTDAPSRVGFECSACKKVFGSHQALGGHRASHKKVKGCFAAKQNELENNVLLLVSGHHVEEEGMENEENNDQSLAMAIVPFNDHFRVAPPLAVQPLRKKQKVHECSICHRVFASGQALGGHKRCHWITSNTSSEPGITSPPTATARLHLQHQLLPPQLELGPMFQNSPERQLDLNLPVPPGGDLVGFRPNMVGSPLRLDVTSASSSAAAAAFGQPSWAEQCNVKEKMAGAATSSGNVIVMDNAKANNREGIRSSNFEDEADSKIKIAKLSELKETNDSQGGDTSTWLQMGIGFSPTHDPSTSH